MAIIEGRTRYEAEKYDLRLERKDHIRAATDLHYPVECIQRLKEAKSGLEMDRIMAEYRKKMKRE